MSRAQAAAHEAADVSAPAVSNGAQLRAEFWALPDDALNDRLTFCAVNYRSLNWAEKLAINGGGPPYMRINRSALYRKRDVLKWMAETGRTVENTAQLVGSVGAHSKVLP